MTGHPDDERAFLDAVHADPSADAPRLIYADWLDENGEPERAEFIRVQCELASTDADDSERARAARRERMLWWSHGTAWRQHLPSTLRGCFFARGFPYPREIQLSPEAVLALDPDYLRYAPSWRVRMHLRAADRLDELASSAKLGSISELTLAIDGVDSAEVEELVDAPGLRHLFELTWTGQPVTNAHLRVIASSPHLAGLRGLGISFNLIESAGAEIIAASRTLRSLRRIELASCRIGVVGLRALCGSTIMATVSELCLPQNAITAWGARALANCPPLRRLGLYANELGNEGVIDLSHHESLRGLAHLDLGMNRVGSAGGRALAESPYLYGVRHLYLGGNRIASDTLVVQALRKRFGAGVTF